MSGRAGYYVTFQFKAPDDGTGLNLYIYNATGQPVYQCKLNPVISQQVVLVNNRGNGIYGYTVRNSNNKTGSGTFVVSHQ